MKRNHKIIIVFLLMIILIGGIFTYINLTTNRVNADGTIKVSLLHRQKVISIAKQEILKNIKTPSTAIFQRDKDIVVLFDKKDMNKYVVQISVDAQNEYGAMIRKEVFIQILLNPDKTYTIENILFL